MNENSISVCHNFMFFNKPKKRAKNVQLRYALINTIKTLAKHSFEIYHQQIKKNAALEKGSNFAN